MPVDKKEVPDIFTWLGFADQKERMATSVYHILIYMIISSMSAKEHFSRYWIIKLKFNI